MAKNTDDLYILSRFPRFMLHQETLWRMEGAYTVHTAQTLTDAIRRTDIAAVDAAPDSCAAFSKAARADVAAWPCLYVHRLDPRHAAQPGDAIQAHRAMEGLRYVGDIGFVYAALRQGQSLARFRRISVGGRNGFDMTRPDPVILRNILP